jgi:hypothetical protein
MRKGRSRHQHTLKHLASYSLHNWRARLSQLPNPAGRATGPAIPDKRHLVMMATISAAEAAGDAIRPAAEAVRPAVPLSVSRLQSLGLLRAPVPAGAASGGYPSITVCPQPFGAPTTARRRLFFFMCGITHHEPTSRRIANGAVYPRADLAVPLLFFCCCLFIFLHASSPELERESRGRFR